jgi:hypothetical protein
MSVGIISLNLESLKNNEDDRLNQSFTNIGRISSPKGQMNHISKKQMSFFINHDLPIIIEHYA